MLSEPASANSAGSLFHSGIVWLVNENLQSSVLALFSLNLCRWARRVRPSAFSMPRSSGVTATSPCTTLYMSVRHWSCRRASNVGHFNLAPQFGYAGLLPRTNATHPPDGTVLDLLQSIFVLVGVWIPYGSCILSW